MIRLLLATLALSLAAGAARADEAPAADAPKAEPVPAADAPKAEPAPAAPKAAPGFRPYDTALTMPAGEVQLGVFAPLRWGITNDLELEIHPLLSLVAPSPTLRVVHARSKFCTLTGEYGLSYPSFLFGLSRGYFFPTGAESGNLQQAIVASAGLVATGPIAERALLTVRGDVAVGIPLTAGNVRPPDSFLAPFELLLAPWLRGYRVHLGVNYDRELVDWIRLRTTLDAYLVGPQPTGYAQSSQGIFSWHVGVDFRVGAQSRFTVGAIWWNWDNFQTALVTGADGYSTRQRIRTNDFLPTLDYVWAF